MYRYITYILFSIITIVPLTGFSQSISVTGITPESPTRLEFGETVNISFDYVIRDSDGVRIFVRPITDGERTLNYAASGSPVYRGRGTGTANFTIEEGETTVDQLRFRVMDKDQNQKKFEFFVPVELSFSSSASFPQPHTPRPSITQPQVDYPISNIDISDYIDLPVEDNTNSSSSGRVPDSADVEKRVIEEDGTIRVYYTGGYERVVEPGPSGNEYVLTPENDTLRTYYLMINVQKASPPKFLNSDSRVSQEWIHRMNDWLKYHNARLMDRIITILGNHPNTKKYLDRYKNIEENKTSTIYEEIDFRYEFMKGLMGSDV